MYINYKVKGLVWVAVGMSGTECEVLLQGLMGSVVGEEMREFLTCPVCGRCITGKNCRQNLRHHLLIHTGAKPFSCPHCPHRANYKPNLLKHIRSVHGPKLNNPVGMSISNAGVVQGMTAGQQTSNISHLSSSQ